MGPLLHVAGLRKALWLYAEWMPSVLQSRATTVACEGALRGNEEPHRRASQPALAPWSAHEWPASSGEYPACLAARAVKYPATRRRDAEGSRAPPTPLLGEESKEAPLLLQPLGRKGHTARCHAAAGRPSCQQTKRAGAQLFKNSVRTCGTSTSGPLAAGTSCALHPLHRTGASCSTSCSEARAHRKSRCQPSETAGIYQGRRQACRSHTHRSKYRRALVQVPLIKVACSAATTSNPTLSSLV